MIPLRAWLTRLSRRQTLLATLDGASIGLLGGAIVFAVSSAVMSGAMPPASAWYIMAVYTMILATAAVVAIVRARRQRPLATARLIEARIPESRNAVFTAIDLMESPRDVHRELISRIDRRAQEILQRHTVADVLPIRPAVRRLAIATGLHVVAILVWITSAAAAHVAGSTTRVSIAHPSVGRVRVTVVPPPYTAREPRRYDNPSRVEALAGSRIQLEIEATADSVAVQTIESRVAARRTTRGGFSAELIASADGFIALEAMAGAGRASERSMIGLAVTPDHAPRVRIAIPAKDLYLATPDRAVPVTVGATDDLALRSLVLRYTKVSGSGEQFTFTEGETPLTIDRSSDSSWTGRGDLSLKSLGLSKGDMVVYRAVATDRRPGAPVAESDTYIIEIGTPGAFLTEGFAADDERDRYGISQQMVILKTEKLIAARKGYAPDSLTQASIGLSTEQRMVRAEFVFMMGGELAEEILASAGMGDLHEEAEAAGEDDVLAGRLANQGRIDLIRAIRSMSLASAALNEGKLDQAILDERTALTYLQRAFSRTRYILRTLSQRERLDLSRRLTGVLSAVGRDVRPPIVAAETPRVLALRRALADLTSIAPDVGAGRPDSPARVVRVAEAIVRADAGAPALQAIAGWLSSAATLPARQRDSVRVLMSRATVALTAAIQRELLPSPAFAGPRSLDPLESALTAELRRAAPRAPPRNP